MVGTVEIYDSTLRDGAQAEGISYSLKDKLILAKRLDSIGIQYIEGGWPNPTNPKDMEFFKKVRDIDFEHAKIVAFGSTRRANNRPEDDQILNTLLETKTEAIAIFGKSWTMHVTKALRISLEENLALIQDSVAYLKAMGREVIYDAEHFFDGFKADSDYALDSILAAEAGGARIVVLCDTNGGTTPFELQTIIRKVQQKLTIPFGVHIHNDIGCAVANSVIAVEMGARQVQGTINGYGERCGNANLCSVIPSIELKLNRCAIGRDNLKKLRDLSRFTSEIANVQNDHRQPYVGASAFAHKGGVHIDAMEKDSSTYEHCAPKEVGNSRRYLLSEQSGGATVVTKIEHLIPGCNKRHPTIQALLAQIKQLENKGYFYEAAEASVEILARKAQGLYREPFRLISFRTLISKTREENMIEAILKLEVNGKIYHTVAEGNGPVHALDQALRKVLEEVYPCLREVQLKDYKVRVIASHDGTAAKVRVLIESSDGQSTWRTIGVSENIIEASWEALLDSIAYKLLKENVLFVEDTAKPVGVDSVETSSPSPALKAI